LRCDSNALLCDALLCNNKVIIHHAVCLPSCSSHCLLSCPLHCLLSCPLR
jgi:hypothetical protein